MKTKSLVLYATFLVAMLITTPGLSELITTSSLSELQEVNPTGVTIIKAYIVSNNEGESLSSQPHLQLDEIVQPAIPPKPSCLESPEYGDGFPFRYSVINLGSSFFLLQGKKAEWLPPDPGSASKSTIAGVDADGDCVRDDIEYFIARKYPNSDQQKARKHLLEYARWTGKFLLPGISSDDAKYYSTMMHKSAKCARIELGNTPSAHKNIDKIFAEHLNTMDRSYRYISNNTLLGGTTSSAEAMIETSCDLDNPIIH